MKWDRIYNPSSHAKQKTKGFGHSFGPKISQREKPGPNLRSLSQQWESMGLQLNMLRNQGLWWTSNKKKWWFQCCLNWLAWKQDGFTKECPHVNPKNLGTCFCFLRRRFSPGGQRWQNWHLYPALGDVDPWSGQTCSVEKAGQIAWPLGPFHFYVHWETWCPKNRTSLQFSKVTKIEHPTMPHKWVHDGPCASPKTPRLQLVRCWKSHGLQIPSACVADPKEGQGIALESCGSSWQDGPQSHQGSNGVIKVLSLELTYPAKWQFWRWYSFSKGGIR